MLSLVFPRRCVLCRKILDKTEFFLCRDCEKEQPEFRRAKRNIPFIAQWTALWYYKDKVRGSIHRFKFRRLKGYADAYAELLSQKLTDTPFDLLTWVPVSPLRKLRRGYDQAALLAAALGQQLKCPVVRTLRKVRHTPPQSGIRDSAQRRANISGAYRAVAPNRFYDKRVLLVDDVVTTGATATECAQTLLLAGAKEVIFAAVAAAENHKK